MDQSGLDGSIYLEMAERLDAGILPHAELPRHAIELPPLTDPLLHTLTTHAARFAYRRPRRTWAIAAVANAAARVHPQTSPLRRGQAAFHEAAAANLLPDPHLLRPPLAQARAHFREANAPAWLTACQWQEYAEPWLHTNFAQAVVALEEALAHLLQVEEMAAFVLPCRLSLAVAYLLTGRADTAQVQAQYGLTAPDPALQIKAWLVQSICDAPQGLPARFAALDQAQAIANDLDAPVWQGRIAQQRGLGYLIQEAYSAAIPHLQAARDIFEQCGLPLWTAQAYNALGQVFRDLGQLRNAREALTQAYGIYRQAGVPGALADNLMDTGKLLNYLGQFPQALAALHQAEAQYRLVGRHMLAAYAILNRGDVDLSQGRYQHALQSLEAAEAELIDLKYPREVATCALRLARVWYLLGQPEPAHHYLDQAAAYFETQDIPVYKAAIYNRRANVLEQEGKLEEAVDWWRRALDVSTSPDMAAQHALTQRALGEGLLALGKLAESAPYLQEAQETFTAMGHSVEQVNGDLALGRYYLQAGDAAAAEAAWERARSQSEGLLPEQTWLAEAGLADLAAQSGRIDAALAAYRRGVAALAQYRRDFWQPEVAGHHFTRVKPTLDAAVRLAATEDAAEDAWYFIEVSKAQTLQRQLADAAMQSTISAVSRRTELSDLAAEIRWLREKLQEVGRQSRLFRSTADPTASPLRRRLREAITRYEKLRARLERQQMGESDADLPAEQAELSRFRRAATQAFGAGWGAISYYLGGDDTLYATWTTAETCRVWHTPIDGLTGFVLGQCAQAQTGERILDRDLALLGDLLMPAFIRSHLHPHTPLLIAPSGKLHSIPWAALRLDNDHLVNRCLPLIIPSADSLVLLHQRQHQRPQPPTTRLRGRILAVSTFANQQQPPLPLVTEERHGLQQLLGAENVSILHDEATTRENLRQWWANQEASEDSFFHVASHAAAGRDNGRLSGIFLYDSELWVDDIWELAPLPSLVTLSACYGSHSLRYDGDETVGLTPTCLAAGASRVVGNLWRVLDPAAATLMVDFYARYAAGATPLTALAASQRAAIRQGHHHAYWGGFVQVGC